MNGKYFEGKKRISKNELIDILETNPFSANELQRRRNLLTATVVCVFTGLAMTVAGAINGPSILVESGAGLMSTGIIVGLFAPSRFWKAIEEYNRSLDEED